MRAEEQRFSEPFINENSFVAKKKTMYNAETKILEKLQLHKQINDVYQQRYLLTDSQETLACNKMVAF